MQILNTCISNSGTDKEPTPKKYKFRAENFDDVISFIAKVAPHLINSHNYQTHTEPQTLDLFVIFKTAHTLDEMHKVLDELDRADGIYNSEKIRNSLNIET